MGQLSKLGKFSMSDKMIYQDLNSEITEPEPVPSVLQTSGRRTNGPRAFSAFLWGRVGAPDYPWAAWARAAQEARAGFEAAGTVTDTATLEAATMLELDRTPGAPTGVWTDQRQGIAGAVMVDALLAALYDGTLQALALPDGSIRLKRG